MAELIEIPLWLWTRVGIRCGYRSPQVKGQFLGERDRHTRRHSADCG